jgi:hypothetical protein
MASTPAELHAFAPSALSGSDGLLVIAEALFHYNRATIIEVASIARVPAVYPEREYADDGGLIAYGPNVVEHFRQAAGSSRQAAFFGPTVANGVLRTWFDLQLAAPCRE